MNGWGSGGIQGKYGLYFVINQSMQSLQMTNRDQILPSRWFLHLGQTHKHPCPQQQQVWAWEGLKGQEGLGSKLAVNFEPLNSYLGFLYCKLPELFFLQHYEGREQCQFIKGIGESQSASTPTPNFLVNISVQSVKTVRRTVTLLQASNEVRRALVIFPYQQSVLREILHLSVSFALLEFCHMCKG